MNHLNYYWGIGRWNKNLTEATNFWIYIDWGWIGQGSSANFASNVKRIQLSELTEILFEIIRMAKVFWLFQGE